jgi:hypothetical protein
VHRLAQDLAGEHAAGLPVAGSLAVAGHYSRPFLRLAAVVAVVVVFRTRRCAAEVAGSFRAALGGGLD